MPKKKVDNTTLPESDNVMEMEGQTELQSPDEAGELLDNALQEDGTVSDGSESSSEEGDITGEDVIDASNPPDMDSADTSDNWPPDDDISVYGDLSSPLDVERRLEEELAALEAESGMDAAGDEPVPVQDDSPAETAEGVSEITPKAPKRKSTTKRKKAETENPASMNDDVDAPAESVSPTTARAEQGEPQKPTPPARPQSPAASFYQTNFNRFDRGLTDEEQQEWNEIYASFRSQSILTGIVAGVDQNRLPVRGENGKVEMKVISSLVVISYRVKVLIPENAIWMRGEERGAFLLRGMIGSTVDYVITNVDREGEVALGSRTLAMVKRRRAFINGNRRAKPGDIVPCSVLVVGPMRCLLTCGGYDVPMRSPDMSYSSILDLRELYRPGQELKARVMDHKPAEGRLKLSVKEASPNPFDGAERRHPVGSRRQAVITGKYGGGVFCTLQDGTLCMCLYSNSHFDSDFLLGDSVIVHISQYDYRQKHIYGRIVSKW